MTGFGQGMAEDERYRIQVTARSVNHRQLDVSLRLREPARGSEQRLHGLVKEKLSRGRVDVSVEIEPLSNPETTVMLNVELLEDLEKMVTSLTGLSWIDGGIRVGELMRIPELLEVKTPSIGWQARDEALLVSAAEQAIAALVSMREIEGLKLLSSAERSLAALRALVDELSLRREVVASATLLSLKARLQAIALEVPVDPVRLAQEAAVLIERADVQEELERLESHLEQADLAIGSAGAIGRRLDFLSQEISRELNTIGAKCRDSKMIQGVLDGKLQCEQLREQVQNVE